MNQRKKKRNTYRMGLLRAAASMPVQRPGASEGLLAGVRSVAGHLTGQDLIDAENDSIRQHLARKHGYE